LTGKCFPLTNFPNDKQTQESLESGFLETTFQKTNTALEKMNFLQNNLLLAHTVWVDETEVNCSCKFSAKRHGNTSVYHPCIKK